MMMLHIEFILFFVRISKLHATVLGQSHLFRSLFAVEEGGTTGILCHANTGLAGFLQ